MILKRQLNKKIMETPMEARWLDNPVLTLAYDFNEEQVFLDANTETLRSMQCWQKEAKSVGGIISNRSHMSYSDFDNVEVFTDRESLRRRIAKMRKTTGQHPAFAALPIILESFLDKLPRRKEIGYSAG